MAIKKIPTKKSSAKVFKRPNINLLLSMTVLVLGLGLLLFQINQQQDVRGRAQITNCAVTAAQLQVVSQEQSLFDQINQYRAQNNLDPLTWDQNLNRAAAWMSKDMSNTGLISHLDSLSRTIEQRFPQCGVSNTNNIGESVVNGAVSADEIFFGWKIDQVDQAVMLNRNFTVGAVAVEVHATGETAFWTFTASGPPTSAGPTVPVSGPTATAFPSPACLGTCPTNPGGNPVLTLTPVPGAPTSPPGGGGGTDPGGGGTDPGGGGTDPGGGGTDPGGGGTDPGGGGTDPGTGGTPGLDPSGNPIDPNTTPGAGGGPGGGIGGGGDNGGPGGLLGLFLAFIALIIQFFLSLMGR